MKPQDGYFETTEQNPFAVQLDSPMNQIASSSVYEMKKYVGDDAIGGSTIPVG